MKVELKIKDLLHKQVRTNKIVTINGTNGKYNIPLETEGVVKSYGDDPENPWVGVQTAEEYVAISPLNLEVLKVSGNPKCGDCKGTGVITLLTSTSKCDCVK